MKYVMTAWCGSEMEGVDGRRGVLTDRHTDRRINIYGSFLCFRFGVSPSLAVLLLFPLQLLTRCCSV